MGDAVPELGDLIESREETGIVCHLSPPIMRTFPFTSYVIYNPNAFKIIQRGAETEVAPVKKELVERIQKYIASLDTSTPTGEGANSLM